MAAHRDLAKHCRCCWPVLLTCCVCSTMVTMALCYGMTPCCGMVLTHGMYMIMYCMPCRSAVQAACRLEPY